MKGDSIMKKKVITILGVMTIGGLLVTGCTGQNNTSTQENAVITTQADMIDNTANVGEGTTNSTTNQGNNQQSNGQISAEKAKEIALEHAGVKEKDVLSIQTKQDIDDGNALYEIEFYTANKKYEYDIKMDDGSVLKVDFEAVQNANNGNGANNPITEKEATDIVLKKVNGATKDMVVLHQDMDDGMLLYEGKLLYNGTEYEFEINAYTGDIIKWEQEAFH